MALIPNMPLWVDIAVRLTPALFTVVVGLLGAYIAHRQFKINQDKLRLDLFSKRLEAFEKLQEYFGHVFREGRVKPDALQPLWEARYKSRFLFGKEIEDYLDTLWKRAIEMQSVYRKLYHDDGRPSLPVGQARTQAAEEHSNMLLAQMEDMKNAAKRYEPYLRFGHIQT